MPKDALPAIVEATVVLGQLRNSLRVHVEVFEPHSARRVVVERHLAQNGFRAVKTPRRYSKTILIDLRPDEDAILKSFHSTCRRHIRAFGNHPLEMKRIVDTSLASRMNELAAETWARTGGDYEPENWGRLISLAASQPDRACLIGVFRKDCEGPDAIVAYVLGVIHGDMAEYSHAASARMADLRAPMLYAPTWRVIKWAKSCKAATFDFGGVTKGTHGSSDPLGGISDFKRSFFAETTDVGGEFLLEPSYGAAVLARLAGAGGRATRRILERILPNTHGRYSKRPYYALGDSGTSESSRRRKRHSERQ
jgi:hypothetical protein